MITKLVTVTCKKDLKSMIRQAESIQKFVEPCEHLVIIEDRVFDKKFWTEQLGKYYTAHTLVIKSYNNFINVEQNGWVRQQALKLLATLDCDDEYLVLDSKDFFIRPCSLADWNGFMGSNIVENIEFVYDFSNPSKKWRMRLALAYSEYFATDLLTDIFDPITPFVIDTKYIDKNTIHKHIEWFLKCFKHDGCEFYFYSYLAKDLIKKFKKHRFKSVKLCYLHMLADNFDLYVKPRLTKAAEDKNTMVAAVHRNLIANFNDEQLAYVNNWIKTVGLTTEL